MAGVSSVCGEALLGSLRSKTGHINAIVSETLFPALSKPAEAPSLTAIKKQSFINKGVPEAWERGNE
jgi:hypothetical protein